MASVGVSSASASGITFDEYPATAKGQESTTHTFGFPGGVSVTCNFKGFGGSATGASETLATTVEPGACSSTSESSITLKMNGCGFVYHPNVGAGSFEIGPAGCGSVTLEGANCTRSFAAQTGLAASFANEGTGSKAVVRITDEVTSLKYTVTKGLKALCGSEGTAKLTGSWILSGYNVGGVQTGAHVVSKLPVGFFLTGKESGEEAAQPKFAAEEYPVGVAGAQKPGAEHVLTFPGGRTVKCNGVDSTSQVSGPTTQLSLDMTYSGCTGTFLGAQRYAVVRPKSCDYILHALNAGPPYSGALDIACNQPGDAMVVDVYKSMEAKELLCSYTLSPQSGLSGISLGNVGEGSGRRVEVGFGLAGLAYTRVSGTQGNCGAGATGVATYVGTSTLTGGK
jgi:hypothetical protein